MITDRIEKKVLLRASRSRIWRALADSEEFGTWFGVRFDAPFAPGTSLTGVIVPTKADEEVAEAQRKYEGAPFQITIETMEQEKLFSFRWHPFAVEPGIDYSAEPTTLVSFELADAEGGILLTITESGFDKIPLERRARAFTADEQGWTMVVTLIGKYLHAN